MHIQHFSFCAVFPFCDNFMPESHKGHLLHRNYEIIACGTVLSFTHFPMYLGVRTVTLQNRYLSQDRCVLMCNRRRLSEKCNKITETSVVLLWMFLCRARTKLIFSGIWLDGWKGFEMLLCHLDIAIATSWLLICCTHY